MVNVGKRTYQKAAARTWAGLWAALLGDAGALRLLWPAVDRPARLAGEVVRPQAWVAGVGADQAVAVLAGAALWLTGAWLGVGLAAGLATSLPGALGRAARRLAAALLPRAWYRVIAGAAGLGVLLSPVAAAANPAAPGAPAPASGPVSVSAPRLPTSRVPAPALPTTSAPRRPLGPPAPPPSPPSQSAAPADGRAHSGGTGPTVTVRPGDSLWRIAADHLPPGASAARIAAAWPRWYATNRRTVGADPDLLLPGQLLHAPEEDL